MRALKGLLLSLLVAACGEDPGEEPGEIAWRREVPAQAVAEIVVRAEEARVLFRTHEEGEVRIAATREARVEREGGRLLLDLGGGPRARLEIASPKGKDLRFSATRGDVEIAGEVGDVVGGVKEGGLLLTARAGRVVFTTRKGDVRVDGGSVRGGRLTTSSGKVLLRFGEGAHRETLEVKAIVGDVEIVLPRGYFGRPNLRTADGKILLSEGMEAVVNVSGKAREAVLRVGRPPPPPRDVAPGLIVDVGRGDIALDRARD